MGELFTFFGLISHVHTFIYMTHMLLAALIVIVIAKMAVSNMKVVPTGTQNLLESYLGGVLAMGADVMGKEEARRYLPLVATIGLFVADANIIGNLQCYEAPSAVVHGALASLYLDDADIRLSWRCCSDR
jgi:F-type H+-transporting ATPase subunit a